MINDTLKNDYIEILLTEVEQNGLNFFAGKINVNDIRNIFTVNAATYKLSNIKLQQDYEELEKDADGLPIDNDAYIQKLKKESKDGYQRFEDQDRIKEIAHYIADANSKTKFHLIPNSIIFSLQVEICNDVKEFEEFAKNNQKGIVLMDKTVGDYSFKTLLIPKIILAEDNYKPLLVIDGHHRLQGAKRFLEQSGENKYEVSATFIFNQISKSEAELFKTINYKAVKVNASYVYQIMGSFLIADSNHEIYLHEVARLFNETEASPLYSRFKMLGKADKDSPKKQTISQAFFIEHIYDWLFARRSSFASVQNLNTKTKKVPVLLPFYNLEPKYSTRLLIKFFIAFKNLYNIKYNDDWDNNPFIKTVPFGALVAIFPFAFAKTLDHFKLNAKQNTLFDENDDVENKKELFEIESYYEKINDINYFEEALQPLFSNNFDLLESYTNTFTQISGQGAVNKIANELFLPQLFNDYKQFEEKSENDPQIIINKPLEKLTIKFNIYINQYLK